MSSSLPPLKNVVVLMLENRSFDDVLGALYPNSATFEGLTFKEFNKDINNNTYKIANNPGSTAVPPLDPGESFVDMTLQIYGNTSGTGSANMIGFVLDYLATSTEYPAIPTSPSICYPTLPRPDASGMDIMNYFTTAGTSPQLPVTSALAQAFAVSDSWFGSCPTQTYANRLFLMCATSGGYVDDCEYGEYLALNHFTPPAFASVFEALDNTFPKNASPANWKIYYHDLPIAPLIIDYVAKAFSGNDGSNITNFDTSGSSVSPTVTPTFLTDAANGTLPIFSLIEPRYGNDSEFSLFANSNHPPYDMLYGEILLANVYNALRSSPQWPNSLLIVIYDEHGGCYDHIAPPTNATAPGTPNLTNPAPQNSFPFTSFGPRVPALIISPFVPTGAVIRPPNFTPGQTSTGVPFDHTSVIATLNEFFGIGTLTKRDAAAPSLGSFLTASPASVTVPSPPSITAPSTPDHLSQIHSSMKKRLAQRKKPGSP